MLFVNSKTEEQILKKFQPEMSENNKAKLLQNEIKIYLLFVNLKTEEQTATEFFKNS